MRIGEDEGWWLERVCPLITGNGIYQGRCLGSKCVMWEQRAEKEPVEGNKIKVGVCLYTERIRCH